MAVEHKATGPRGASGRFTLARAHGDDDAIAPAAREKQCFVELLASDSRLETLLQLPPLRCLARDIVRLVCTYGLECVAVAEWYERRDDWAAALRFYECATLFESDAAADYKAGFCYMFGMNAVCVDVPRTLNLLERSAAGGCAESRHVFMGCHGYSESFVSAADDSDSCNWLTHQPFSHTLAPPTGTYDPRYLQVVERAAQGCVRSQCTLGTFLRLYDPPESLRLLLHAARRGHVLVQYAMYHHRCLLDPEKDGSCFEWSLRAAEAGHVQAMVRVCDCYLLGEEVEMDMALFVHWLKRAAAAGHVASQRRLDARRRDGTHPPTEPPSVAAATT